jgi:hypothetical protein
MFHDFCSFASVRETSVELVMLTNNIFQISLSELAICYALAFNNRKCDSDVILLISRKFLLGTFLNLWACMYV